MINGKRLRRLRLAQRWGLRAFAEKIGVSHVTLLRYERGERDPRTGTLRKIETILGLEKGELIRE